MAEAFNRDEIISQLWHSPDVAAAIGKMKPIELQEDLRQELFVVLCKMDPGKMQGMFERGELRWFVARVIVNMVKSNRSEFFTVHRKFNEQIIDSQCYILPDGLVARKIREESRGADLSFYHDTPKTNQPEELIHRSETDQSINWGDHVSAVVDDLDPYEADMIRLYSEMGYNCQNIADATGIQARSVRYAVNQARQKAKSKLLSMQ